MIVINFAKKIELVQYLKRKVNLKKLFYINIINYIAFNNISIYFDLNVKNKKKYLQTCEQIALLHFFKPYYFNLFWIVFFFK